MEMSAMDLLIKWLILGGYHLGATPFLRTAHPMFCNFVQNEHATLSIFTLQLWVIIFYNKQAGLHLLIRTKTRDNTLKFSIW